MVAGDFVTLDPYAAHATTLTWALARPVYRSLYRLAPDGSPVPDLAREIEPRPGGVLVRVGAGTDPADVVASARRARPPSGFAGATVRRAGAGAVLVRGEAANWPARLARGTWVLPGGRATGKGGGPFRVVRQRAGFEVVLEARQGARPAPFLARVRVKVAPASDVALALLESGRADAASIPSSVNLEERAAEAGLRFRARRGWEFVLLDFSESGFVAPERRWVARRAAAPSVAEGLIRDAGERALPRRAGGESPPGALLLATPGSDELLQLILRALRHRLVREGVAAEAVSVPAGDPMPGGAVRLVRTVGAPGAGIRRRPGALSLFRVDSVLLWRGLEGLAPNPTLDGPLWNLERWREAAEG